jgi:plastocyanin
MCHPGEVAGSSTHQEGSMPMSNILRRLTAFTTVLALGVLVSCDEGGFGTLAPEPGAPADPGGSPNEPTVPRGNAAARIAAVSGGAQTASTGELLDEPFVVEVTDDRGIRVEGATVTWTLVKGSAPIDETTITGDDGRTDVTYKAGDLGRSTVEARVDGVLRSVQFTVDTRTMVIKILDGVFYGYNGPDSISVPTGTLVKISNSDTDQHRITTLSAPPSGSLLESETLGQDDTYFFMPNVRGTWTFGCDIHPVESEAVLAVG